MICNISGGTQFYEMSFNRTLPILFSFNVMNIFYLKIIYNIIHLRFYFVVLIKTKIFENFCYFLFYEMKAKNFE